ncbi:MAG: LAGLIDADG family homing endonuclease, partial [Tepidisphaeraceae bacterium]
CLPRDGRAAIHLCLTPELKPRIEAVVNDKFGVSLKETRHQKTEKITNGWIYSRLAYEFFVQALGVDPADKLRVPQCVFRSPEAVVAAFLNGLWDADGYDVPNSVVSYLATTSRVLADGVALLFLSLGRSPYIHTIRNPLIYKEGVCYRVGSKSHDVIPSARGVYRSEKSGKWHWRTAKGPTCLGIQRRTLEESGLKHPLNRVGWFYAEVASVEPAGEERVYDLVVPQEEAFVANGFVAHNCSVWKRDPVPRLLPIQDGWNILDDNLLACPRPHVEAVFAMLRRQRRRVEFTGGLEARALEDYQVGLLAGLRPRPNCFWAYDPGDDFETLRSAAARLLAAGFTARSHRLRCYVLIGYPKDNFELAEKRLKDMLNLGFTPMAMLWRPETASAQRWAPALDWRAFQRRWARPALIHHGVESED